MKNDAVMTYEDKEVFMGRKGEIHVAVFVLCLT